MAEPHELADDLAKSDVADPTLHAAGRLLNALLPTTQFLADDAMTAWLALEALRIWIERGPGPTLVGPASYIGFGAVAVRGDYGAGYRALRRILAASEARGYEGTSQARYLLATSSSCWFEPIESSVQEAQRVREELIAEGDLAMAGYTYYQSGVGLVDYAPSLDIYAAELDAGRGFLRRTGSEPVVQLLDGYQWLTRVLRDGSAAADEAISLDRYDAVAGRPRRGRTGQIPAPAAVARGRAGLGGRDFRATVLAFDAALREVAGRRRPWHRALIAERAGHFYLAHGVDHTGSDLLAQARHEYAAWGATAKVAQLDWAYPALRPPADATACCRRGHRRTR